MASRPVSDYTVEELQVGVKKLTSLCIILASFFGLLLVAMVVYSQINPGFKLIVPVIAMVCCIMPAIGIQLGNRTKLVKELEKRESQSG